MFEINVQCLSLRHGRHSLLDDASFSMHTGAVLGLHGVNGSGKSTLLKSIFGTHKPTKLLWALNGQILGKPSPKNSLIALLPQDSFLPRDLTTSEILAMVYKTDDKQKPLYQQPYIGDYALKKMNELSHGAARYVEIMVILHLWHPFILLDEPFSMLAPLHKEAVKKCIVEKSETKGIVIADHYTEDVNNVSTSKIVLADKKLHSW